MRRLLLAAAAVALALAIASLALAAIPATKDKVAIPRQLRNPTTLGRVAFVSDFEREGLPEWFVQALPERVTLVGSGAYEGQDAARFEVRPGDIEPETGSARAEVSGPYFHEGQDLYVRTAFRIPSSNSFRGPWQLIQQFHEADWNGSPGTAVFLNSDRRIRIGHGDSSQIDWNGPRLRIGRWYDLVYRVKFSRDPSVGFVEVWLEGRHQKLTNGRYREHGRTLQRPTVYLKSGIYRDSSSKGTSVIEDDSIMVIERLTGSTHN